MTEQELKECIAEVKYSAIPDKSKKMIIDVLYEKQMKSEETVNEIENIEVRR